MLNTCTKQYWKPLGLSVMSIGIIVLLYALFILITSSQEPLLGVFLFLVAVPAILPAVFGFFMYKGHVWAAIVIRISIFITLFLSLCLDLFLGLDVLSYLPSSIPFIFSTISMNGGKFA